MGSVAFNLINGNDAQTIVKTEWFSGSAFRSRPIQNSQALSALDFSYSQVSWALCALGPGSAINFKLGVLVNLQKHSSGSAPAWSITVLPFLQVLQIKVDVWAINSCIPFCLAILFAFRMPHWFVIRPSAANWPKYKHNNGKVKLHAILLKNKKRMSHI